VALAIVDGDEIDWDALQRAAADEGALLGNLRLVADIGARLRPAGEDSPPLPPAPRPVGLGLRAVVALSLVQTFGAMVGLAFGSPDGRPIPPVFPIATSTAFSVAAVWLLLGGRHDRRATYLAGFFLAHASAGAQRFLDRLPSVLPGMLGPLAAVLGACTLETFMPLFLWLFVREFPRIVRWGRFEGLLRVAAQLSALLGGLLFATNLAARLRYPEGPSHDPLLGMLTRSHDSGVYWTALFVSCIPALAMAIIRVREARPMERRRVALFVFALGLGIAPLLLDVLLDYAAPSYRAFKDKPGVRTWTAGLLYLSLMTIPFTTAYSVLANQVLSIRLTARRLGRSRLTAWAFLALGALPLATFAVHLNEHRNQSLDSLLATGMGRFLAIAAVLGLATLLARERLQRSMAPSAARHMAEWREVLVDLVPKLRAASRSSELQAELTTQFRRVLAVDDLFLLGREKGRGFVPSGAGGRALRERSALVTLALADAGHLLVDPADAKSLYPFLPDYDRQWVTDSGTGCLVPIVATDVERQVIGLLAVGQRRDDVPFATDDILFARAMATALALALEGHELRADTRREDDAERERAAQECLSCGRVEAWNAEVCPCGGGLTAALIPRVLNGKFELGRVLGRGAMGVAYEARDLVLDRVVALKAMPRVSLDVGNRLRREARAMASVVHPHLALILGAESWKGVPVLVVEHLAGGTLEARLRPPWPWAHALALGADVAAALEAMHAQGLAHRDVKPSNIGFTSDGAVRLLDFGLARLWEESQADSGEPRPPARDRESWAETMSRGSVGGTPLYLPPEAFAGKDPGAAQDLWALAAVIYELIAGDHPFRASIQDPFSAWWVEPCPDIRRIQPSCPAPVADWLARALHRDPAERPGSARAFRQQLVNLAG
jgi:Protein kinase domain